MTEQPEEFTCCECGLDCSCIVDFAGERFCFDCLALAAESMREDAALAELDHNDSFGG